MYPRDKPSKPRNSILTTHGMDGIERVCNRLIMIDYGMVFYNGASSDFRNEFGYPYRIVVRIGTASVVERPCMAVKFMWFLHYKMAQKPASATGC
ncbi:MAG: hypothetical protein LBG43_03840 [Treponema sp.]|jgi:ABC-type uncharacterized transport system ATPase subunit|nr:hypothetical protein [Treponema sp.]